LRYIARTCLKWERKEREEETKGEEKGEGREDRMERKIRYT
jgi:hypothetical protein